MISVTDLGYDWQASTTLSDIEVGAFDPRGESDAYDWAAENYPSLVGRAWHDGNLTLGNLDMAEGLLYIDGDVTITGNISGKGAIVATGKITVTGSMNTDSDHAALVSGKDLTIRGQGAASSQFQGLIYSKGDIDISKTTIMGAAVSMSDTGVTKLEDTKFIKTPELTAMKFEQHVKLEEAKKSAFQVGAGGQGPSADVSVGIRELDGTITLLDDAHTDALKALASELASSGASWEFGMMTPSGFNPRPTDGGTDFLRARNNWSGYVEQHRTNQVEVIPVFDLDLNQLISMDVQLEMLLHRTVSRRPE